MHHNFIKGRKILLIDKKGRQEIAKFRVSDKGILYFFDHEPVRLDKIRCATYYKPQTALSK